MAHILAIEDDSMLAALEKDFLEANGFTVTVAATGKEGLKVFDGGCVDAVLLATCRIPMGISFVKRCATQAMCRFSLSRQGAVMRR